MKRYYGKYRRQRGQVLLLGVAVMIVLLIAAMLLFDLHNVLRAKIKVESAQQAAALAGAQWQVAGLNLLGEVNLLKACTLMLSEDPSLPTTPFVPPEGNFSDRKLERLEKIHRMETRLRTLNETQSRISFIVPLLGYAAVQQTAKQNGMNDDNGILQHYFTSTLPLNDYRDKAIEGYLWYEPYRRLVGDIAGQKAAVRCNARINELPEVWSNPEGSRKINGGESSFRLLLSEEALYNAIEQENFCYWQLLKMAKAGVYLADPWWKISYIPGNFIGESELLPLGVSYGPGADVPQLYSHGLLQQFSAASAWNLDPSLQPDSWCMYDSKWYGQNVHQEAYEAQQMYWSGGNWLRNDRKAGFLYEGAVSAVDGSVSTSRSMTVKAAPQNAPELLIKDPLKSRRDVAQVEVGRTSTQSAVNLGVVAKVLGGFHDLRNEDDAPTVTPLILPVFSRGLLIPSTMPYSVTMLTKGDDSLKRFLQWLATWPDIDREAPPPGTARYLELIRRLMDPEYILSIYNPNFPGLDALTPAAIFERSYFYPALPNGAGWLQQAYLTRAAAPMRVHYTGKKLQDGSWETELVPALNDHVVTELPQTYVDEKGVLRRYYSDFSDAVRGYYGSKETGYYYYIRRSGKIQTNEDIACGGKWYYGGSGGMTMGTQSGPPRL